jgi:hypothetical protein
MARKFFHYTELEENKAGMWSIVRGEQRKKNIIDAAELMKDVGSFEWAMRQAIDNWPNSVQHNLMADGVNKIAWLGHAGCCFALGVPEENTRCAWHTLTQSEQDEANAAAAKVLRFCESCQSVASTLPLFEAANA